VRRARRRHGDDRPAPLPALRDLAKIERPPELTDGFVRLRAPREKDRADTVQALNDEVAARFLYRVPYPYASEDFDAWVETCATAWGEKRDAHWNIARADDDTYLGGVSLMIEEDRFAGELGYQVVPWARGTGVAAAAARLVRDWGLDELGLERLEIHADADNIGSQRVALSVGMRHEGLMRGYLSARGERRDYVLLAMRASDPRERIAPLPEPRLGDGFVVVRPLEPDDAPAVAAACQDPLIQERCYFVPALYSLADAEAFIAESRRALVSGSGVDCAVCATDGELLGAINLNVFPNREAAETGYWVKREARGRGVATAALRLMAAYAFEQAGAERLELMTETPNVASQRLAEKLGFRREGVARAYLASRGERDRDLVDPAHGRIDQVLYALLRPEWEAAASA
jgi:RimJ/RimL family protein N-acetyltransferase